MVTTREVTSHVVRALTRDRSRLGSQSGDGLLARNSMVVHTPRKGIGEGRSLRSLHREASGKYGVIVGISSGTLKDSYKGNVSIPSLENIYCLGLALNFG